MTTSPVSIIIGIVSVALGLSFAWKCFTAVSKGKYYQWKGFLPIDVISPFFIHLPPGKRSLIVEVRDWWIPMIYGPVFFLCSIFLLTYGLDEMGMNGTRNINWLITFGQDITPVIYRSGDGKYSFPIFVKAGQQVSDSITKPTIDSKMSVPVFQNAGQDMMESALGVDDKEKTDRKKRDKEAKDAASKSASDSSKPKKTLLQQFMDGSNGSTASPTPSTQTGQTNPAPQPANNP